MALMVGGRRRLGAGRGGGAHFVWFDWMSKESCFFCFL